MDIRGFFGAKTPKDKIVPPAEVAKPVPLAKEKVEEEQEEEFEGGSFKPTKNRSKVIQDDDDECSTAVIKINDENKEIMAKKEASTNIIKLTATKSALPALSQPVVQSAVSQPVAQPAVTHANTTTDQNIDEDLDEIPADLQSIISWEPGKSVPYLALVEAFEKVAATSGRLEKESILCNLFRSVIVTTPSELSVLVHLSSNSVASAYENIELGIGDSLLVKAICESTGRKKENVEEDYKREGDLGIVALMSRSSQKTLSFGAKPAATAAKSSLTAAHVFDQLKKISLTKGDKAQSRKVDLIKAMIIKCVGSEAKYLVRALQGKLRIGTANQTVLVALANAFVHTVPRSVLAQQRAARARGAGEAEDGDAAAEGDGSLPVDITPENFLRVIDSLQIKEPAEAVRLRTHQKKLSKAEKLELAVVAVKKAFSECPNLHTLTTALLDAPVYDVHRTCKLIPGIPIAPMLAKPTKEINEVLKRLNGLEFTMEYKYDGERAQVHVCEDGTVKIFSRNSEDNTLKYPDLIEIVR